LLFLGFYLTPVFYDPASLPPQLQTIYRLNPLVTILDGYRSVFIYGEFPAALPLIMVGGFSAILLWLTWRTFQQASRRFVEEL